MGGESPSYNNVTIDTSTVRGFAEKLFAEGRDNVAPNMKIIMGKLSPKGGGGAAATETIGTSGYSYSGSWISSYHAGCVEQAQKLLRDVRISWTAIANAAASIAEDHERVDEANAADIKKAFTPPPPPPKTGGPGPHPV